MRIDKGWPLLLALVWISLHPGSAAFAQTKDAPDTAKIATAKNLLKAIGFASTFQAGLQSMLSGLAKNYKQQGQQNSELIDGYLNRVRERLMARTDEIIASLAPVYAEEFSVEQMNQIIAFYETPVGKKFVSAQPNLLKKSAPISENWFATIGKEINNELLGQLQKGQR